MMSTHIQTTRHEDGWVVLLFDQQDKKVNVLSSVTMEELRSRLDSLGKESCRGLLIASGKPSSFIAGANVDEIAGIRDPAEAEAKSKLGQEIFNRLETLPFPTVAAVSGVCLGGGLELALACDAIVGADDDRVKLGAPEVKLGFIPGWGGTLRLPRRIGLTSGIDLVVSGRELRSKQALRAGLLDAVLPREDFNQRALAWARENATRKRSKARAVTRSRSLTGRWMNRVLETTGPGRNLLFGQVKKRILARTKGHYPAPLAALDVIRRGLSLSDQEALALEAETLAGLLTSPESKRLVGIFLGTEAQKKLSAYPQAREVTNAAVLGAGIMGGGIAQLLTTRNIRVRMKDIDSGALATGFAAAWKVYEGRVKRRRMKREEAYRRMSLLSGTLDYSGFGRVDVVIEAVVENLEVKRKVLEEVESKTSERTLFASNTSTLPISQIAAQARRPENVVGMHFFNPVHRMPLVEVIVGEKTSAEACDTVAVLAVKLGKIPVVVKDSPGFLVNRILTPYLREAARLLEEGESIERVDLILRNFGMPMGPFELMDEIGLDVAHKAAAVLQEAFKERWAGGLERLEAMVEDGALGKKSGRGFYVYEKGKKKPGADSSARKGSHETDSQQIGKRLILPMILESSRCLDEGIVADSGQLDLAMIMGIGFPPFRGGPLHYADALGLERVVEESRGFADSLGPTFDPPRGIVQLAKSGGSFTGGAAAK